MNVKIFADGADREGMLRLADEPFVSGFTTNPTLMRQAGVSNYEFFAREMLSAITEKPISFEVFSDEFDDMERQALKIASWGDNVYVKIPVTNTRGESSGDLLRRLTAQGVQLNVTALFTPAQVAQVAECLEGGRAGFVSVFAGRIADAGVDPLPIMVDAVRILAELPHLELIWASPREIFNVVQADNIGCHVITVTHDLLRKLSSIGKDLDEFSLETVKMFYNDASAAGYTL